MIRSLPRSKTYDWSFNLFIILYFTFLFAPLVVTCVLAFNDSNFPSLPWQGFSLDWFFADGPERIGLFHDSQNLRSIVTSFQTAFFVSILSVVVGTCASFLFEKEEFRFKGALYFLMLAPLVIPGVILGISLLLASNTAGTYFDDTFGIDVELFRPSFWLVIVGQFSFISTFVTLVISARLRKFDHSLEEAALNLGATEFEVIWHITLKFLRPAIVGAGAVAFLMSFENFNTTLFLVGSEPTLPINLYLQVRDGSTPVINAVSLMLIVGTSLLALVNLYFSKKGGLVFFDRLPARGYICAHRGARALAPENTMLAAELCLELGADFWEMDVQKTADGKLVVFHDDVLNRTTDVEHLPDLAERNPWNTNDFSHEEMQLLDCGSWFTSTDPYGTVKNGEIPDKVLEQIPGQKIPSFREALEFTVRNSFPMNIEIKDQINAPGNLSIVDAVLKEVHAAGAQDLVLVSSFNHDYLAEMKRLAPHIPLSVLEEKKHADDIVGYLKKFNAVGYHPDSEMTDFELVRTLAAQGVQVTPFTVNDMKKALTFIENGAFGVTTDYTHSLREELDNRP